MGNKTRHTANLVSDNNLFVDIANDRVGIGSTQPTAKLNVAGIVSATSFRGDGSQLSGISVDSSSLVDSNSTTRVQANAAGAVVTGILTATKFFGDASNVTGIVTTNLGKANVTISDNPPGIGTAHGDLWWESDTAKGHIYYNDGSSAQWVEFNPSSGGGSGSSYENSDVDAHLNTGTASSGEVLSWNGSDYDWVAQSGGGGISAVGIQSGGVLVGSASTINFVTTGSVSVSNDIATVSFGSSIRFVGARIYHDNYSPTAAASWTEVTNWDGTSIDTHSFVDSSNGFTIPAGVSKVRITMGGKPSAGVSNQWTIRKNGGVLDVNDGGIYVEAESSGYQNGSVTGTTAVLSVSQGDTFDLRYYLSSTTPTWDIFFEIEVIEGDILGDYFAGSSYTDANVDAHLNVSGASSGQILSWNGSDYAWVTDQTGGGSGITTANINADTINSGTLNVSGVSTLGVTTATYFLTSQFESVGYSTFKGRVVFDEILEFRGLEIGGANKLDFYDSSSLLRHSIGYDGTDFTVGGGDSVKIDSSLSGDVKISRGGTGIATFTESGLNVTGVVTATSFSGSGAGLTNLPSSQLTGALPAIDGSALTNVGAGSTNLVTTWTLGANGSSDYTFTGPGVADGAQDPTIYLVRGQTYKFENRSGGHPFRIQYEFQNTSGTAYNDGIVNNGANHNTDLYWEVRNDAPDLLHYQCTAHGGMSGRIVILGDVVSSGSWTASAGTAQTIDTITGVANNAIKTAEYTIHIENGSNMQAQKVLVMQDGTTAFSQEYAIMHKSGLLVSMSATISGGNLLLQATPETGVSGTTTYKVTRQTMR